MWSIHTLEYYLAIKSNEVPVHAKTCIKLENSTLG